MTEKKEPVIAAFLCNWCSYAGADLAGEMHKNIPACVKPLKVMCTGRMDAAFIMSAFSEGADGVMVLGCHPGDCHYKSGNKMAKARMEVLSGMLSEMGIEKERLMIDWVSASEGEKFAKITHEMAERINKLGFLK